MKHKIIIILSLFTLILASCENTSECGDRSLDLGEYCDQLEGCEWDCSACSRNWRAQNPSASQTICVPDCGDGYKMYGIEECDDGNTISGDGCSQYCELEYRCRENEVEINGYESVDPNNSGSIHIINGENDYVILSSGAELSYIDSCRDTSTIREYYCKTTNWKSTIAEAEAEVGFEDLQCQAYNPYGQGTKWCCTLGTHCSNYNCL